MLKEQINTGGMKNGEMPKSMSVRDGHAKLIKKTIQKVMDQGRSFDAIDYYTKTNLTRGGNTFDNQIFASI